MQNTQPQLQKCSIQDLDLIIKCDYYFVSFSN